MVQQYLMLVTIDVMILILTVIDIQLCALTKYNFVSKCHTIVQTLAISTIQCWQYINSL